MKGYFTKLNRQYSFSALVIRLIKSKQKFNSFFWIVLGGNSNFTLNFIRLGFYKHKGLKKLCFIWIEELMNWIYFGATVTYKLKRLLFLINLLTVTNKFFLLFNKKSLLFLDTDWIFFDLFIYKFLKYEQYSFFQETTTFSTFLALDSDSKLDSDSELIPNLSLKSKLNRNTILDLDPDSELELCPDLELEIDTESD